jgi:hypothetical protein
VSIRSALLQAARLARRPLGDAAAGRVLRFLQGQVGPDGSFPDRAGKPDLYYTVFGLMGLDALGAPPPASAFSQYLPSFGNGASLDFIHLGCLARCWAMGPAGAPPEVRRTVLSQLEKYRAADGGYASDPGLPAGTAYGAFLALATYQDLGEDVPQEDRLAASLETLRTADGGYTNEVGLPFASVPATSAAITILRELDQPAAPEAASWLLSCTAPEGGFYAAPGIPMPDLLSTATALHAARLADAAADGPTRAACLEFVRNLLAESGGFCGHTVDGQADCEYTFYGLLALGHLL